jgi:post-segregation antitoxin (ccd killing protein)
MIRKYLSPEAVNQHKRKFTFSISDNEIERANAAGINISAITERLLHAVTYRPNNGNARGDVAAAYDALFEAIIPILEEYGTTVQVGGNPEYDKSYQ